MDDATSQPLTILLVDDNPNLLKLMRLGLPDLGNFTVETAEDGIEGLTKCLTLHPDCMVIDVMMPGLDGYQLVRALRGDPETASTPLILLTARVQDKDQFVGLASGADRYLCKPVMPSELSVAIAEAVQVSAAERTKNAATLADKPIEENDH
jgi:CheY-like chemotaxis protein